MTSILLFAFLGTTASAATPQYVVIAKRVEGVIAAHGNGLNRLFPSEIVQVIKHDGTKLLVKRLDEQPSFEVRTSEENEKAMLPTWIAVSDTVTFSSFKRVLTWQGPPSYISCAASCDSGVEYKFSKDGSFTATWDDNHSPAISWSGHLFKWNTFIWPRVEHRNINDKVEEVLNIKSDGTICTYVECFGDL